MMLFPQSVVERCSPKALAHYTCHATHTGTITSPRHTRAEACRWQGAYGPIAITLGKRGPTRQAHTRHFASNATRQTTIRVLMFRNLSVIAQPTYAKEERSPARHPTCQGVLHHKKRWTAQADGAAPWRAHGGGSSIAGPPERREHLLFCMQGRPSKDGRMQLLEPTPPIISNHPQ